MPSKEGLIAAARAHVEATHPGDCPRRIEITTDAGIRITIELLANGHNGNGRAPAMPLPCRGLSPLESSVLEVLAAVGGAWRTAQQLAEATQQSKSSYFMAVLSNLAEAEVIESSTKNGYRLIGIHSDNPAGN